jgi:hypothetical protein
MKEGYRELTVSSVRRYSNQTDMSFSDSAVGLVANNDWLREHGVNPVEIVEGSKVHIKGRGPHGNEDCMLCSPNPLEDFQLAEN